jgi:hypothetical protein
MIAGMIPLMPWTSRRFEHAWPVEMLPVFLERLRGTPLRAAALLNEFSGERVRDGRGSWSALEHIGHLDDLHELDVRRLDEYLSEARVLSAADMSNVATYSAKHNDRATATVLDRLRTRRLELVDRLEQLTPEQAARSAEHPRLRRPLALVDWVYFVAEHDDHHLAAARAVLRAASP